MKIEEQIFFTMGTFKRLEDLGKLDGDSVNMQCQIAIESYLKIRNLSKEVQQIILSLLKDPHSVKQGITNSLKRFSKKDKTTVGLQIEKAISTYTAIRSLPEKAENEIYNLINHHISRNNGN